MMPKVKNLRDGFDVGAVYVGRPSPWGNPYRIDFLRDDRHNVVAAFREYAVRRAAKEPGWLAPLRGRDLLCFCAPLECHADVLLELANA